MAIIDSRDLFDFDDYNRQLTQASANAAAFAAASEASVNRIHAAYAGVITQIAQLNTQIASVNLGGSGSSTQLASLGQQVAGVTQRAAEYQAALTRLNAAQSASQLSISDLKKLLDGLQQEYRQLIPTQADYAQRQAAIAAQLRGVSAALTAQNTVLRGATAAATAANGSYAHLAQQTADLRNQLRNMPGAFDLTTGAINHTNAAAVALQRQINQNSQALHNASASMGNHTLNVGNYGSALAGLGSKALLATGGLIGITSALDAIQKVGSITLQFDSLDSALKVVSNDTELFTKRQTMLKQISEDLGQDLSVVEKNYTSITASSLGTKLQGEATDKIFTQIVGTLGRLKRPADEVNRALLAVGQMMSKGTVASEELKGQLGEVLPGAFGAAARSIGVTTAKLSDMLKNGEVIASDFLPKFAAELEHTFNPNNERRVEGLGANLARLRNEGVEWVKSLNIGDATGSFIGNITSMARSVRELFNPLGQITAKLADQTDAVKRLESGLPPLLSRYDELKSKSKLSADEQKELQTVVNDLVGLAPSAATGFDRYGNALDINKGKVLSFTAAQQALNRELNKQVLAGLQKETEGGMQRAAQTQSTLNRGTEQQSFNFKPYFLMTDAEKAQSTSKDAGKRREVPLTDNKRVGLQSSLQEENKQIELNIIRRLQLGDKLTQADEKFIAGSNNSGLKQTKVIAEYNDKIAELTLKQGDLLLKGDEVSRKQREGVLKELKDYEAKRQALISPTLAKANTADGDDPAAAKRRKAEEAARKKATLAADQRLRDAMSRSEATSQKDLSILNDQHQDGLVSEQDYIEKRLQITLAGLNQRQAMLEKANKTETDDYQKVLEEKVKAESDYKRAQVQNDLKTNKGQTTEKLSTLDASHSAGEVTDLDYIERRHTIIKQGIAQDRAILREAGQQETELYRATNTANEKEDADYSTRKLNALKKLWKQELTTTKEGLKEIDQQVGADYEAQLNQIEQKYATKIQGVQLNVASGKTNANDGEVQIHQLRLQQLEEEVRATQDAYAKDQQLSRALVDAQIEYLEQYKAYAILNAAQIEEANQRIRDLEKERDKNAAEDKIKLDNKVADNAIKKSNEEASAKQKAADLLKSQQQKVADLAIQIAETSVNGIFSIEQQKTQNALTELDKRKQYELTLAGDNADAKVKIEQDYDRKSRELKHKQDVDNRAQSIFNILLNTAVAVTKALIEGGPLGVALAILYGGLGAIQLGVAIGTPLPAYKTGKKVGDTYSGPALAGEAGTELFVDRDGASRLLTKPTLINTQKGDQVFTAYETQRLLASWQGKPSGLQLSDEIVAIDNTAAGLRAGRVNELKVIMGASVGNTPTLTEAQVKRAFAEAMKEAPRHETHIDQDGFHEYLRQSHSRTEYLNRRHRMR